MNCIEGDALVRSKWMVQQLLVQGTWQGLPCCPATFGFVTVIRSILLCCMEGVALPMHISVGRNPLVWVEFPVASWIEDQVTSRSLRWVGT